MSTEFRLYNVDEKDLYVNKSKEEKELLHKEMAKMAIERGIKPTARYFNTYPPTVRKYLKLYKEKLKEGENNDV